MGGESGSHRSCTPVGMRQAARLCSPVAAHPLAPWGLEGRSHRRTDPVQQARVCTWMGAGPTGMARSGAASEVAGPRAQLLPYGKRPGVRKAGGAPRATRAPYAPSCPQVPHGQGRRAGAGPAATASASGAAFRGAGRSGLCGSPKAAALGRGGAVQRPRRAPCSRRLGAQAVTRRGGGAGTLAPSCVQPQTYSKFPRSCKRPKIVTCASPLGGRGCFSLGSKEAFRRLRFSVSAPVEWLSAASETRALRAGYHEGLSSHTRTYTHKHLPTRSSHR